VQVIFYYPYCYFFNVFLVNGHLGSGCTCHSNLCISVGNDLFLKIIFIFIVGAKGLLIVIKNRQRS
jgi:hypothetical protein